MLLSRLSRVTARATTRAMSGHRKLPHFAVEQWPGWESGLPILSNSDCEPLSLKALLSMASQEMQEKYDDMDLSYSHQQGSPELRDDIAKTFETNHPQVSNQPVPITITPQNINVVVPAEGIFLAMTSVLEEGDNVVVTMPCYQSLYQIAKTTGCNVTPWKPTCR